MNEALVFSVPRSGSTLIYNLIKELMKVDKIHTYSAVHNKVIITYRDFRECVISHKRVNKTSIIKSILEIKRYIKHLKKYDGKEVLYLEYSKFKDNFDYAFNELEKFLGLEYKEDLRKYIKNKYSKENVIKIQSKFKSFKFYDKDTKIHGEHINLGEDYKIPKILYYIFRKDLISYGFFNENKNYYKKC